MSSFPNGTVTTSIDETNVAANCDRTWQNCVPFQKSRLKPFLANLGLLPDSIFMPLAEPMSVWLNGEHQLPAADSNLVRLSCRAIALRTYVPGTDYSPPACATDEPFERSQREKERNR